MYIIKYMGLWEISILSNDPQKAPIISHIKNIWTLYSIHEHRILILNKEFVYNDITLNTRIKNLSVVFLPIDDMEVSLKTINVLASTTVCPISYDREVSSNDGVNFGTQVMLHTSSVPKYLKPWQSIILK